jgi:hypothetical protein
MRILKNNTMIREIYFTDLKQALKASFRNKVACYISAADNIRLWLSKGEIIYLEKTRTNR